MAVRVLRAVVAAALAVSALLKAADFAATATLFGSTFGWEAPRARALLALLVLVELALAAALALRLRPERGVCLAVLAMLAGFAGVAGWMMAAGMENCGCFGTRFEMGPGATIVKNLVLMSMVAVLYRRTEGPGAASAPQLVEG